MGTDATELRRSVGRLRLIAVILFLVCIGLLIAVIALAVISKNGHDDADGIKSCSKGSHTINLAEPENPSVFHDLTTKEMEGLSKYLYSQKSLNLVEPENAQVNSSHAFLAEIYLPRKSDVLNYLDRNGEKPSREALVTIFRGDRSPPDVLEIIVSPLPNPTKHTIKQTVKFDYRPMNFPEYIGVLDQITEMTHQIAQGPILESYGGKLKDCGNKCLFFKYITPMSSAVTGDAKRKMWFWLAYDIEFYVLNPVDFSVLMLLDGPNYIMEHVWYNGQDFPSLQSFVDRYNSNTLNKQKLSYPKRTEDYYSKMTLRQPAFPTKPLRNPIQVEPDGKRYSIDGRHVKYMNWDFDFRMSSAHGPQIYDIRYKNERIVYELGVQEMSAFYSAHKPAQKFCNFFDTFGLVGPQAKSLVPGADCPEHSTFISASHYLETSKSPVTFQNAFCLFEHNTGLPLRRHHSYSKFQGKFYEGMESVVLILRTMMVIINYDYIFDFIFYQNGAMEVKVVSTGYILANPYSPEEHQYGFQLQDNLNGNMHLHTFNFKVDMDIKGTSNRYETLDILPEAVPNIYDSRPNKNYHQNKFNRSIKATEQEAAYKFNFETPKYLLFYNENKKNKYGNPQAYRVLLRGMAKNLIPEGEGNEPAQSWSRYQLAVSKHKDTERHSSSLYALYDSDDPVIQFQHFIDDNEVINDQDLVTWITMGMHHIPHTEDLPVTPTPGMDRSFFLLPYNYFPEDPAMHSRNALRIEPKDKMDPYSGVTAERYDVMNKLRCVPIDNQFDDEIEKDPSVILETGENSGGTAI